MAEKTKLGLDENIEGLLCYVFGFITGIVFLVLEGDNKFVRFHAFQSIATFLPLFLLGFVLSFIPYIGWGLGIMLNILDFILWLILMLKAYQGEKYKLPIVGNFAEEEA